MPRSRQQMPILGRGPLSMAAGATTACRIALLAGALTTLAVPAFAHGGAEIAARAAWSAWQVTPDIAIPLALLAVDYVLGMARRHAASPAPWWRHVLFFSGLIAIFLALQSPLDPIAEHLFFVHQIQHLLLRMIGPMLLALSWPESRLIAGLPGPARRRLLAPVASHVAMRRTLRFLGHPAVATTLFVAALYVWEIPRFHDAALLDEPLHYLMHVTMLLAGLVFWWRVFDRRGPRAGTEIGEADGGGRAPQGLRYGVRGMMLWFAILSNILLGAYTTLKTTVLYAAYGAQDRLFGYPPLEDEQIGGVIIWIPSSMMCLIALLVVVHLWGLHETQAHERLTARPDSNSAALLLPTTPAAIADRARAKNRAMAAGFCLFVLTIFATAILSGIFYNLSADLSG